MIKKFIDRLLGKSGPAKPAVPLGKRVEVAADEHGIDQSLLDAYAKMIRHMEDTYYITVNRYTTSAFMRAKLGEELSKRNVAPHVFESAEEAQAFRNDPVTGDAG